MKLKLSKRYKRFIERNFIENFYKIYPEILLSKLGYDIVEDSTRQESYFCETDGNRIVRFKFDRGRILFWYLELHGIQIASGDGIIELYSLDKGCGARKSVSDISHLLSINLNTPPCAVYEGPYSPTIRPYNRLIPHTIDVDGRCFSLRSRYYRMNFDGSYSGAIFQWFDNEDYIELPLFYFDINPVVFFDLFLSPVSTFQYFNHYDLIFNNNKATIILCDNFVLSEKINIIISESKRVDYSVFVAISFEYNGKSSLENCIDVLHDRDVVYIPNASNKSFSNLQFIENVKEVASSFRIQKKLIFFDDASSKPSLLPEFDFLATYFVNSAVKIDEHGSGIVFDIVKFSVLYEEYLDWCRYVGLLNDVVAFDEISFLELDKISRSFDIDNLRPCFESLFSYPNITLLYGLQRSSKSIFLLTILYAISAGFDVFDLNVFNSKRVLLIDFFANSDSFINRLYSIHLPYLKNKPLCSNFYSILMSDVKFAEKFDFLSAKFQKFIEKHVVESRCEIIAFDNFPFTSEQGDYFVKDFGKIFEWLRYIQNKYSIGICISYEQSSGRDIFLNQLADYKFSNIIKINQHKSFDFENSHPSINQGSLENTISVQYEYISNYMSLNKTEACFCKPHANNLVDSKWIKLQNKLTKNDFVIDKKSKHSSYETIVLKYMKDNKNRDFFLRDEIDKLLNKKPGTSRIVLNNLINKELVRKIGSNPRSIKYEYIGL